MAGALRECTFWRTPYGSNAVLKSPHDCAMLRSSMRRVGLIDITGRQRDAPRRIATFLHATLRVAPHRYATLEPLGKPGGSRAFSGAFHLEGTDDLNNRGRPRR